MPKQRTVSSMTRLSKRHIEGAFEVAEVLGEGSAALGRRLHPCAGFSLKEFFGGVDVPGILQLAQVDGEVAAGQAQRLLDKAMGHAVRVRPGHQQRHYSQPCGLMDRLIEDDRFLIHAMLLLRIHTHATTTTASMSTADTKGAASSAKCLGR